MGVGTHSYYCRKAQVTKYIEPLSMKNGRRGSKAACNNVHFKLLNVNDNL